MTEFEIPELNLWDCRVRHFDGWTLEIIGGISSSLEIAPAKILRFTGVSYLECPMEFHHPQIRHATPEESSRLAKTGGDRFRTIRLRYHSRICGQQLRRAGFLCHRRRAFRRKR